MYARNLDDAPVAVDHQVGFGSHGGDYTDGALTLREVDMTYTRRTLVIGLGVLSVSPASLAFGQPVSRRTPRVGVLWHAGSEEEERVPLGALRQGLKDIGYVEGRTIVFENRYPNEEPERFVSLATELTNLKVDVLVAVTRPAALAAQKATSTIPIVFLAVPDPVGDRLVETLARPGNHITGITNMAPELVPKRIEPSRKLFRKCLALGSSST